MQNNDYLSFIYFCQFRALLQDNFYKISKIFVFCDFAFIFPKIAIKKVKRIDSNDTEDIYET